MLVTDSSLSSYRKTNNKLWMRVYFVPWAMYWVRTKKVM